MRFFSLCAISAIVATLASCSGAGISPVAPADIIPVPAEIVATPGVWTPGETVSLSIIGLGQTDSLRVAARINSVLSTPATTASAESADIRFECVPASDPAISPEAYTLEITPEGATVSASRASGLFYGAVTLSELLRGGRGVRCAIVSDTPRFHYRGMMLDVSRHFRDTSFIRKQIDAMARLKLNNLHLHLTDAAGWRMEIKSYPKLTDFAAWRDGKTWKEWNERGNRYLSIDNPEAEGGFYTQQELKELVDYAADRFINIVPEIEMPSHSEEVTAAYPELSCTHQQYHQPDLCPGNEATFDFIERVLDEVMEVFPSKMIHVGGDEAPKTAWRTCSLCAKRMESESIDDVDGLQSYLIKRVERYLNSHGRDLLGWDEIMEGGLAPNAAVMSWRGTEGGKRAAAEGHRVIMTPGRYCYLDAYQDAPATQPEAIGGYLPLSTVYGYNPTEGMSADMVPSIYGLQGNLFAEYIPTAGHAEYMLYPRMYAIAERGWSPETISDYADFKRRAALLATDMRAGGYNTFDIENEVGNRKEAACDDRHLAYSASVEYIRHPWANYPANGEATLTDGRHGGWNYNDERWQAFVGPGTTRMDVVVDMGEEKDITSVGADFMQICGPDVWMPAKVVIEAGITRDNLSLLAEIHNKVERDSLVSFKHFGWTGSAKARFVRYRADADSVFGGVLFTDEIVVR